MKVIYFEDEEGEYNAYDPKHLKDGLSSREPMKRYGYGQREEIENWSDESERMVPSTSK